MTAFPQEFRQTDDDPRFVWRCRWCNTKIEKTDVQCPKCGKTKFERLTLNQYNRAAKMQKLLIPMIIIAAILFVAAGGIYVYAGTKEAKQRELMEQLQYQQQIQQQQSIPENYITAETFNQIREGMNYSDVVSIVGFDGKSGGQNEDGTITMTWNGISQDTYALVTFRNSFVVSKSSVGLEIDAASANSAQITLAEFNEIKTGMSYTEVCEIIGGLGELMSESEIMGYTSSMYSWEGTSFASNAVITFSNNEVISKSQFGLE